MKNLFWNIIFLLSIHASYTQVIINVNPSDKKQTITGIGAKMQPAMIDDLIIDVGCSSLRIDAGGFDGYMNEQANDNNDPNSLDLSAFTGMSGTKLTAVQKAVNRGVKIIATVGSPPLWQKDTNSIYMWWKHLQLFGKPASEYMFFRYKYDCGGELRSDMYDEFGEFAAGSALLFKQQTGFDLYGFIPQNEPEFTEPYGSCVYSATQMFNATKAMGEKFALNGVNTKIAFAAQCFPQNNIIKWAKPINNDSICKNYVSAFTNHDYSSDPMGGGMATPSQWVDVYREANRVTPFKEVWMDEGGPGYGKETPLQISIGGMIEFYKSMFYGNCNLFMVHEFQKKEAIRYGAMKNMIRYIRPGSYRIKAVAATDTLSVFPLVFKHDGSGSTTIFLVNASSINKSIKFNGISGKFDAFQTSNRYACHWVNQYDLSNNIDLPAMSITTLVNCSDNHLPTINAIDTIVLIKNSAVKSFDLSGITDGGDGNQVIAVKASQSELTTKIFESTDVIYSSPSATASLNLLPKANLTGMAYIDFTVSDNSKAMDSMYNEKVLSVPAYILPYINNPPIMDDVPDQNYTMAQINLSQMFLLSNVSDGNDGQQKLSLSAVSSSPTIATVSTQGSGVLNITPKSKGSTIITVTLTDDGINAGGGKGSITKMFKVNVGPVNISGQDIDPHIYPNPASDLLYVSDKELRFDKIQIISITGAIVSEENIPGETKTISLRDLNSGTYIVRLIGKKEILEQKLLIEK